MRGSSTCLFANSISAILSRLALDLGDQLPNFARDGDKTHLLIKDLRALRRPVLLVLDTFEKAAGVFHDWVCQHRLAEVERALALTVVIAGQRPFPMQKIRAGETSAATCRSLRSRTLPTGNRG